MSKDLKEALKELCIRKLVLGLSNNCYFCNSEIKTVKNCEIVNSYWSKLWRICHTKCLPKYKEMCIEQQKIDTNCNDCKFLNRKNTSCNKFNKKVKPSNNYCQVWNIDCFEHRKTQTT